MKKLLIQFLVSKRNQLPGFLLIITLLISCQGNRSHHKDTPGEPPNILWIVAENIKLDLGCYGAELVQTPNIDFLAEQGIRYTHVFSTSPVCAPSRSAFMTGMYQTTTDMHNMRSHRDDDYKLPDGIRPITHWLQDKGYFTANISEIEGKVVGTGKLDLNFVNEGPIYNSTNWKDLKNSQPFFAMINTPEVEYDIYDRKSVEKERVKWVGEEYHPQIANVENVTPPPYYPDTEVTRQEWARYLNSISGMDIRIGWILDQLKMEGLMDNTVIIFFGDNGRLEARGIHWLWDTGIHVPMIVLWPENYPKPPQYKKGGEIHDVLSLLDITATTLSIAGIEKPKGMQSNVFLGEQNDPKRSYAVSARDRIDETIDRVRSIRGERYHYIRNFLPGKGYPSLNRYKEKCFLVKPLMRKLYQEGKLSGAPADLMESPPYEMLYDTELDPHEITNLADSEDPLHQEVLIQMRNALDSWMEETGDLGDIMEPAEIVSPFEKEMHDWFGTPDWYLVENNQ
jgi:arylsulfatase A-like enzyme